MKSNWKSKRWWQIDLIIMIGACVIPLMPFKDLHFDFAYEWKIHLYNIAYFGEYIRQHFIFPSVINTQDLVGWVLPIFYGTSFYGLTGFLAGFLGAAVAYRLFVAALFLVQYILVRKLTESFGGDRFFSHGFAILMTWAIYPLTNIFNRSAATEFAAVAALNCGFFCWMLLVAEPAKWKKTVIPWAFGFFFAFSAGSHPITALYGSLTFAVFWIFTFSTAKEKKYLLRLSIFSALGAFLIISPWVYAVAKFRPYFQINGLANKIWFSPSIDWFWTKVNLFPYDPRPPDDSTPHLDAQMATPFFILSIYILFLIFRSRNSKKNFVIPPVAAFSGILFVLFFILSSAESLWNHIPVHYHIIQMAYRLVSYLNLTIFFVAASLLGALVKSGDIKEIKGVKILLGGLLLISFIAVEMKDVRAVQTVNWGRIPGLVERDPQKLLQIIPYGNENMARNNYVTNYLFNHEEHPDLGSVTIAIPVLLSPKQFGETGVYLFSLEKDAVLKTNVQAFPWNHVLIDDQPVSPSDTQEINNNLAVKVKAGTHAARYVFLPPAVWRLLNSLSFYLFLDWILLLAAVGIWQTFRTITKKDTP